MQNVTEIPNFILIQEKLVPILFSDRVHRYSGIGSLIWASLPFFREIFHSFFSGIFVINLCYIIRGISIFHIIREISLFPPVYYPDPATINWFLDISVLTWTSWYCIGHLGTQYWTVRNLDETIRYWPQLFGTYCQYFCTSSSLIYDPKVNGYVFLIVPV